MGSKCERARSSNVSREQGNEKCDLGCHTGVRARARESKRIASSCFGRFARISGEKKHFFSLNIRLTAGFNTVKRVTIT